MNCAEAGGGERSGGRDWSEGSVDGAERGVDSHEGEEGSSDEGGHGFLFVTVRGRMAWWFLNVCLGVNGFRVIVCGSPWRSGAQGRRKSWHPDWQIEITGSG